MPLFSQYIPLKLSIDSAKLDKFLMSSAFLPAARFHSLTPLYEAAVKPFMFGTWKKIVEEVSRRAPKGGTVVDLGCGPGSILRMLRVVRPDLRLIGVDIDPTIVAIAQNRANSKSIEFHIASIDQTPLTSSSADVVISTLMFHHLPTKTKRNAFTEARRILRAKGAFLLCDFSIPQHRAWLSIRWWKYLEPEIEPQFQGQLLELGKQAKAKVDTLFTSYGCISLHAFTFED